MTELIEKSLEADVSRRLAAQPPKPSSKGRPRRAAGNAPWSEVHGVQDGARYRDTDPAVIESTITTRRSNQARIAD
jgi:hypothetical protein